MEQSEPLPGKIEHAGRVVIFSGPSGVGKDTVLDAWIQADPRVERVITYTTRARRANETNGVDYHFVSEERFRELEIAGSFLEAKFVHGHYYASPLAVLSELLAQGKIAVLKIDVQGALDAMAMLPEARTIFVLPPSFDELERRIRERSTEDQAAIGIRLSNAQGELAVADRYEIRVVNDDVERVVRELMELFP